MKYYNKQTDIGRKRRIRNMLIISFILCFLLVIRVGIIQLIQGQKLSDMAYFQQTLNRSINPKRGTIYDCTGKNILAVSASVESVYITPSNIKDEDKEKVARALSEIFELDYEEVLKKVNRRTSIETIVKKVDKEKTDKLRIWMEDNNIFSGINIDEDTKRYYPYSNLASHVIGFTGSDNQGLNGIEIMYDDILKGTKGKILKITDAKGADLENEGENYINANSGDDLILTIDMNIQAIAEKYLTKACIDNKCTDGGNILIINPKNGDILALASYPTFDLNNPYEINEDNLKEIWDTLSQEEKNTKLEQILRNKSISDTYEPGSTFKIVTASSALEEGRESSVSPPFFT